MNLEGHRAKMNEEIGIEDVAPGLVIVITLIGAFLRMFLLSSQGLWLDETFSVWLASHGVADLLQWAVRLDQSPPLYYLILHYWMGLNGDTPYDVRLLSVLFGAGTIPIIYLIGKRLSGEMMGVAAAVLLALSPFNIIFAQEARMYTCLAFNAALVMYALLRLLTDSRSVLPIGSQFREYLRAWRTSSPVEAASAGNFSHKFDIPDQTGWRAWISRHRWLPIQSIETDLAWVAFIVFSAASLLTHNTAVLLPVATNIFVLALMFFRKRSGTGSSSAFQVPSLGNWIKAQIGIFLLWSPWLFAFITQTRRVDQEFWLPAPTWDSVIQTLGSFLNDFVLGQTRQSPILWVLYALVLCLGAWHYRKDMARFFFLAALFALPLLGELIVSLRRPIFYDRTLIWITIPLILVLAAGITQLKFRSLVLIGLVVFGTNNLFTAGDNYRFIQKEDWSSAAGYVAYSAKKDDLVLFNAALVQIPFDYYFKPYEIQYSIQVEKHGAPMDLFAEGSLKQKMTEADLPGLMDMLRGHKRVWLVYSRDSYTDPMGLIPQTLASQLKLVKERDFYGGKVQLYENP